MYGRGKFSQSRQMKDLFYSIVKAFNRKVVFISWELSIISVLFFRNNTSPLSSFDRFIKYPFASVRKVLGNICQPNKQ